MNKLLAVFNIKKLQNVIKLCSLCVCILWSVSLERLILGTCAPFDTVSDSFPSTACKSILRSDFPAELPALDKKRNRARNGTPGNCVLSTP